jgi:hypothetical protein
MLKIKLYQISSEKDKNRMMFMNYKFAMNHGGIDYDSYELVFEGEVDAKRLDDIYHIFNLKHPEGHKGRSMSVSDIVYAEGLGCFFCDSIGFQPVKKPN